MFAKNAREICAGSIWERPADVVYNANGLRMADTAVTRTDGGRVTG